MNALSDEQLIEMWKTYPPEDVDLENKEQVMEVMKQREALYDRLIEKNLVPKALQKTIDTYEADSGLYPSTDDPMFLHKLMKKQEFAENKQMSVAESIRKGIDPCKSSTGFELSPTQRFIGQFLSPKTPYMSALLYHGVGVGKTCSAVTVAERYLEMFPRKQVIVVAPRNIQPNFAREIFSETKLVLGDEDEANEYMGCTGDTYLKLTGTEFVRNKAVIMNRVSALRSRRYQFVGYLAFYNYLRDLLDSKVGRGQMDDNRRRQEEYKILKKKFSNCLIIIDEAHNVRDLTETEDDLGDAPGGKAEMSESLAGKRLTPYLRKLLDAAEGTKLLLLTATPMYNSYKEIIPLLNLLLINDKKAPVSEGDFFDNEGNFIEGGEKKFGNYIQAYVSFMRGENPLAFPIRLKPENLPLVTSWPTKNPLGATITNVNDVLDHIVELPFVATQFKDAGLDDYSSIVRKLLGTSGLRLNATDGLVQAGNFMFPGLAGTTPETRIREQGFKGAFSETKDSSRTRQQQPRRPRGQAEDETAQQVEIKPEPRQFRLNSGIPTNWLHENELQRYSPKCDMILKRLRTTEGVTFIYSRFVYSGALSIALALEANGYELAGRNVGYLKDVPLAPGGKQCALCEKKQGEHDGSDHSFQQAKYILLTGRDDLTPNNKGSIELATKVENKNGELVKVVIGSQVASEGIDLKFIREVLVFDSWYHLNKLEQVIGRGIRFCSHAALEKMKRNCTVTLLLTTFPSAQNQESIDMYQYRIGFEKAYQIGQITRVMKEYAVDCNLNHEAVMITGLDPIDLIDSQRDKREKYPIDDVPFSSVCDWIEDCTYQCATKVKIDLLQTDDSTYDEYAAKWRAHMVKERLRKLFEVQHFYSYDKLIGNLTDIPRVAIAAILSDVVGNRSFRIRVNGETGYIIYKNRYFLFQPDRLQDLGIPIALRTGFFPVKQDSYEDIEPARIAARPVVAPVARQEQNAAVVVEAQPQQEEEAAAVEIPSMEIRGDVVAFWDTMITMILAIQAGTLSDARSDKKILPDSIEFAIRNRYIGNKKAEDKAYNIISMIHRFYQDIKGNADWREIFMYAATKFLWDEVLNIEEQYAVYKAKKANPSTLMSLIWDEHIVVYEGETIYRRVNPITGMIEYKCDGGDCSPALITAFEGEPESSDELRALRANTSTTGNPYGTVNYKNGLFVFKTNVPVPPSGNPQVREKQERGSECANVPNMKPHYKLLEDIGEIAQAAIGSKLGFTVTDLQEAQPPRSVKNSVRACALTDLALRFFDELRVQDKRWFYRPLPTFYTKHPGILRKKTT